MEDDEVDVDWHHEVLEQLRFHWGHLRRRLEGLTDDEYLWEPVPGWSVRLGDDGTVTVDREVPEPDPPPFTTIAWRLCHLVADVLGSRSYHHLGDDRFAPDRWEAPATAAGGLAQLDASYAAWTSGLEALGLSGFHRRASRDEVGYHGPAMASLALHINREVIHHGAEIACLRDLYRDLRGGGLAGPGGTPIG